MINSGMTTLMTSSKKRKVIFVYSSGHSVNYQEQNSKHFLEELKRINTSTQ